VLCDKLDRLRSVDGEPISLPTPRAQAALCPNLEDHDLTGSHSRLLETRTGLRLWTGREILRARCALPHEQQLSEGVERCTPVRHMKRSSYAVTGEAVDYLEALGRANRHCLMLYDVSVEWGTSGRQAGAGDVPCWNLEDQP
jgi:DNA-binding GntR family transcriptional regulator